MISKGRKLHRDRKHVKQSLRQFVSEGDEETDYAIMSMSSKEKFPRRVGGTNGTNTRRRQ